MDSLSSYGYMKTNINEGTDIYLPFIGLSHFLSNSLEKCFLLVFVH